MDAGQELLFRDRTAMKHIEKLLKRVVDQAIEGNTSLCELLESKASSDQWVQLTWDSINASYPFADEPIATMRDLGLPVPSFLELDSWKPHSFVTFEHGANTFDEISAFVAAYFEKVLGTSAAEKDLRIVEEQL